MLAQLLLLLTLAGNQDIKYVIPNYPAPEIVHYQVVKIIWDQDTNKVEWEVITYSISRSEWIKLYGPFTPDDWKEWSINRGCLILRAGVFIRQTI